MLLGTEEYIRTLIRKGESKRIQEVLQNQVRDIRKYVAETFIKIEYIKEFTKYLEYKERSMTIPRVEEILSSWDETVSSLNDKLTEFAKKY